MQIRFTKVNPTHHTFEIVRSDGTSETKLLETKSFMPHDLIHFVYELLAGRKESFYGLLAKGETMQMLDDRDYMNNPANKEAELTITEKIVGPLSSYLTDEGTEEGFLEGLGNLFGADDLTIPAHMTQNFLRDLKASYRALIGQWSSLPHHKTMEIAWED